MFGHTLNSLGCSPKAFLQNWNIFPKHVLTNLKHLRQKRSNKVRTSSPKEFLQSSNIFAKSVLSSYVYIQKLRLGAWPHNYDHLSIRYAKKNDPHISTEAWNKTIYIFEDTQTIIPLLFGSRVPLARIDEFPAISISSMSSIGPFRFVILLDDHELENSIPRSLNSSFCVYPMSLVQ